VTTERTAPAEAKRRAIEDELDDLLQMSAEDAGELFLVRHAEPARSQGHDPMLSCTGLVQAERLADRIGSTWLDAVYCSPERRAQQTARVLGGPAGRPVHVLQGLTEIEFDAERFPDGCRVGSYADEFDRMPRWESLPGFEWGRRFRSRIVQSIERVLAINPARRVVIVTHASVINAYVSVLLSVPADRVFTPEHTSVSIVRWRQGRYALRCLNDLSHLSMQPGALAGSQLFTVR
jgi:2,3-bisphosphoglycerate-dependent phosphoglycerate mutase